MRRIDLEKAETARASTMRDINRKIVLNYVRDRQPISRADIARATALQRSTVSTIVEHLRHDGLVEEIGSGESSGGRRPTLLQLRAEGVLAVGVDVAPTLTTIVTSDLNGQIRDRREFPTSSNAEKMTESIIETVKDMRRRGDARRMAGIGVSLPGLVDAASSEALYIPYFGWRNWKIGKHLHDATNLRVVVDNDANAAALAELWFGIAHAEAERDVMRDFIMVIVAEGVGTGIVFDGQIYRGERGAAGEFGHMVIGSGAPSTCSCGNRDCWEAFASGRAAVARYEKLREGKQRRSVKQSDNKNNNGDEVEMSLTHIIDCALDGEQSAITALQETARYLGIGISNLIVGFSPESIIIGGALTRAWSLIESQLQETVERSVRRGLPSSRIAASSLGDQPTLMGALSLILARKFATSTAA
ncbi:MAG: ROK family transcriptional regulator [Pyrinomonadaceae bacterium MAG19_C2-C3]|nr:ROK family transcriptional regulator [Pyrinomonadaceae bacterium MAG19_C2-C3]